MMKRQAEAAKDRAHDKLSSIGYREKDTYHWGSVYIVQLVVIDNNAKLTVGNAIVPECQVNPCLRVRRRLLCMHYLRADICQYFN
jgi:hypothetical protein